MALIDTLGGAAGTAYSGQSILAGLIARIQAWQTARQTEKALHGLSARQLTDIGIDPRDLGGYAEGLTRSRY